MEEVSIEFPHNLFILQWKQSGFFYYYYFLISPYIWQSLFFCLIVSWSSAFLIDFVTRLINKNHFVNKKMRKRAKKKKRNIWVATGGFWTVASTIFVWLIVYQKEKGVLGGAKLVDMYLPQPAEEYASNSHGEDM